MKNAVKAAIVPPLLALLALPARARQSVFPRSPSVGDEVEVRVEFDSPVDFSREEISVQSFPFPSDCDDYTLKKSFVEKIGRSCFFTLSFVPWKTGEIEFPRMDMARMAGARASVSIPVVMEPIEIRSLLSEGEGLCDAAGPLLLPGTIYAVYALAAALIAAAASLALLALKFPALRALAKRASMSRAARRNAKKFQERLRRLGESNERDEIFCEKMQNAAREYLGAKLGVDFKSVVSSKISAEVEKIFAGTLSVEKQEAVESIERAMRRADYIRFARGSADSKIFPASAAREERLEIVRELSDAALALEAEAKA